MLCKEMPLDSFSDEMLERAFLELQEGSFENAIEQFTEYLLVKPFEARAYQGRALANFKIKNWPAALANFKQAKELDPDDPENWLGLGMSLAIANEIYEAIDVLEALTKNHPHFTRGYIQLGRLYYQLGIIKKGHEQMDLALASRPSLADRRLAEELKKEQLNLDKKRFYRPDFVALNAQKKVSLSRPWLQKIFSLFKSKKSL